MREQRAYHESVGDPCTRCEIPAARHFPDKRKREGDRHTTRVGQWRKHSKPKKHKTDAERDTVYIGIDGEGQGRKDHRYVFMAASTEKGDREWMVDANPRIGRLTTVECLDMILDMPTRRTKIFSFSFNYDLTKMLMDLDDEGLFILFRPELRKGKWGPEPMAWCPNGSGSCKRDPDGEWDCFCGEMYLLNLQGTKFSVTKNHKRVVIWDLFKFFQAKFVSALEDWKVGSPELWKRMTHMKDKRADFDKESPQAVKDYCLEETRCIAQLARKLIESHDKAELKLRTYYGAGSSGAAMLETMGIKDKLSPTPEAMKLAVASAFFGGRFENSVIGAIREPLENLDISSAYVYQLAFLPCLEHGSWRHTTKRGEIETAQAQSGALVRYSLGKEKDAGRFAKSWGPFPFRTKDGSISFPIESGGGWVWLDEFLAGERIFTHVRFHEAWVYTSNCNCKPFGRIPEYYNLRLQIGKEGPGIVIKLGMNSCYGKLAQSVGNAIFQSWIWAGMITSGCRAQLLQVLALHKTPSNCLMFATDGILTRERGLTLPEPLPTGTAKAFPDVQKDGTIKMVSKPLGGWERKHAPKGVFIARPGIYFPLNPTKEEIKQVRARGVGRSVVLESWKIIMDAWEHGGKTPDGIPYKKHDAEHAVATVANVSRFCGAKTSISLSLKTGKYKRAQGVGTKPAYGQWKTREVSLTFNPMPKRDCVNPDGQTLKLRKFPPDQMSVPYSKAVMGKSKESKELRAAMQELTEQPDGDLTMYEFDI